MKIGIRTPSLKKSLKARTTGRLKRAVKKTYNPLYGKKGMGLATDPKKAIYNKVYEKVTVDSLESLKKEISNKEDKIGNLNKQSNQLDGVINITIDSNTQLTEEDENNIEKWEEQTELWKENNEKYRKYISESLNISEEIFEKNLYSKAINQANIKNKYSDRYTELCDRLLQLLPYEIEYDKKDAEIRNQEYRARGMGNHLVNYIRLLEKQEKYNEIINVLRYLLSLGITEDGTKKGIKGRIEKAITKFNEKFNTNYIYRPDENLIIDDNTGEIME